MPLVQPLELSLQLTPLLHWLEALCMYVCTFVINFNHFCWIGIVIHDHSSVANHRYTADFTRVKPAYMDMRIHAISKFQIKMGNIFDIRLHVGMCLYLDSFGPLIKKIQ